MKPEQLISLETIRAQVPRKGEDCPIRKGMEYMWLSSNTPSSEKIQTEKTQMIADLVQQAKETDALPYIAYLQLFLSGIDAYSKVNSTGKLPRDCVDCRYDYNCYVAHTIGPNPDYGIRKPRNLKI